MLPPSRLTFGQRLKIMMPFGLASMWAWALLMDRGWDIDPTSKFVLYLAGYSLPACGYYALSLVERRTHEKLTRPTANPAV